MSAEVVSIGEARAAREEVLKELIAAQVEKSTQEVMDRLADGRALAEMMPQQRAAIARDLAIEQLMILNQDAIRKFVESFLRAVEYFVIEQQERGEAVDVLKILTMIFLDPRFGQLGIELRFGTEPWYEDVRRLVELRSNMLAEHRRFSALTVPV
jgi:hypothetical protein